MSVNLNFIIIIGRDNVGKTSTADTFVEHFNRIHGIVNKRVSFADVLKNIYIQTNTLGIKSKFELEAQKKADKSEVREQLIRLGQAIKKCSSNPYFFVNALFDSAILEAIKESVDDDSTKVCNIFIDDLRFIEEVKGLKKKVDEYYEKYSILKSIKIIPIHLDSSKGKDTTLTSEQVETLYQEFSMFQDVPLGIISQTSVVPKEIFYTDGTDYGFTKLLLRFQQVLQNTN